MVIPDYIYNLILDRFDGTLSKEGKSDLLAWINESKVNEDVYRDLIAQFFRIKASYKWGKINFGTAFGFLYFKLNNKKLISSIVFSVAATVFILFGFTIFTLNGVFTFDSNNMVASSFSPEVPSVLNGGSSKAVLLLADGEEVKLGTSTEVFSKNDGDVRINETGDGAINYVNVKNKSVVEKIKYNILKIPVGGEYKLILSDGTKVWLNSSSSLRYPIKFIGKDRRVFLNGEAYFEVSHDKLHPFRITTSDVKLEVLGTSFNVNAYEDESQVVTTLVEGSVKLKYENIDESTLLKPSQQSVFCKSERSVEVNVVDVYPYVSWKDGRIIFKDTPLYDIFKRLARWYDFEVVYGDEEVKRMRFFVNVNRYRRINEVLDKLQKTRGIRFNIEGNKIVVYSPD